MKLYFSCPFKTVTVETWNIIELAELAIDGHWPVLAGSLDQSATFVEAVRRVKNEKRKHEQ